MAYTGASVPVFDLLFAPEHNLIDQSLSSRSATTITNGDGFGLGWYGRRDDPGLYRSIRPAWNDDNLRDLATHVEAHAIVAHVRATSQARVQETNCHPFRSGRWLFAHNGHIAEIERVRRDLLLTVEPARFPDILGSTDSEVMFHMALSMGLDQDPLTGLARMVGVVEQVCRDHGIAPCLWATFCVTNGSDIWAVRYASDGNAPTLFLSPTIEELNRLNPEAAGHFGPRAVAVVSEPPGRFQDAWRPVDQGTSVTIREGKVSEAPFVPIVPSARAG